MIGRLAIVFACFERRSVRYVVIGGIAAVLHGVPRATFDVDVLIEPSRENAAALLDALREAGFGTADLITADALLEREIVVFSDRVRIDVLTSTPGLAFADAWRDKETVEHAGARFFLVSKAHLIASKLAAGRPKDLDDVKMLQVSGPAKS
jgi:hypothetical protein